MRYSPRALHTPDLNYTAREWCTVVEIFLYKPHGIDKWPNEKSGRWRIAYGGLTHMHYMCIYKGRRKRNGHFWLEHFLLLGAEREREAEKEREKERESFNGFSFLFFISLVP